MTDIDWKPQAIQDLEAIEDFYLKTAPHYGRVIVDNIMAATRQLKRFPQSGRMVPEIDDPAIQEIFHQKFRIIYLYKKGQGRIEILTIMHTSQQLGSI